MQISKIIKLNGTLCFEANQGAMAAFLEGSGNVKFQNAALKIRLSDLPTPYRADQPEDAAPSTPPNMCIFELHQWIIKLKPAVQRYGGCISVLGWALRS